MAYLLAEVEELKPIPVGWFTFDQLKKAIGGSSSKTGVFVKKMRKAGRLRSQKWKIRGTGKIPAVTIFIYQVLKAPVKS